MNAPMMITEAETSFGTVRVYRNTGPRMHDIWYSISVNDKIHHNGCSAEDAIRALSHYLNGTKK